MTTTDEAAQVRRWCPVCHNEVVYVTSYRGSYWYHLSTGQIHGWSAAQGRHDVNTFAPDRLLTTEPA